MRDEDFARVAEDFANSFTCYLYGFWGQKLTREEYNRVNALPAIHGDNNKFGNQKYIGTGVFPFDCICLLKADLAGATVDHRISYSQMASNPMGDISNADFLKLMQRNGNINPKDAKRGMGLATKGHAAIALGNGRWVDANFINGQQNGVMIHETGIEQFTCAGRIPGVEYSDGVKVGDVIPMTVTKIENGIAYGEAKVDVSQEIKVGSKVTIAKGAVSGGGNPKYANQPILSKYANGKYVDTVAEIGTFNGEQQARLAGINTWVAFKYLTVVG